MLVQCLYKYNLLKNQKVYILTFSLNSLKKLLITTAYRLKLVTKSNPTHITIIIKAIINPYKYEPKKS